MPTAKPYTVTVVARGVEKSIVSSLTFAEAVAVAAEKLTDSSFAVSLVDQEKNTRHGLSPKQSDWLVFLAQEYLDRAAARATATVTTSATKTIGTLEGIYNLFNEARKHLKRARIRVQTADGRMVVIKVATKGRFPGSLLISDGRPYGENTFYGYVHATGESTVRDSGVNDILTRLASDPAGTAAEYGKGNNECCFCGRSLTNSEAGSAEVGYGPICASHYGLPWAPNGKTFAATEGNAVAHVHTNECDHEHETNDGTNGTGILDYNQMIIQAINDGWVWNAKMSPEDNIQSAIAHINFKANVPAKTVKTKKTRSKKGA